MKWGIALVESPLTTPTLLKLLPHFLPIPEDSVLREGAPVGQRKEWPWPSLLTCLSLPSWVLERLGASTEHSDVCFQSCRWTLTFVASQYLLQETWINLYHFEIVNWTFHTKLSLVVEDLYHRLGGASDLWSELFFSVPIQYRQLQTSSSDIRRSCIINLSTSSIFSSVHAVFSTPDLGSCSTWLFLSEILLNHRLKLAWLICSSSWAFFKIL